MKLIILSLALLMNSALAVEGYRVDLATKCHQKKNSLDVGVKLRCESSGIFSAMSYSWRPEFNSKLHNWCIKIESESTWKKLGCSGNPGYVHKSYLVVNPLPKIGEKVYVGIDNRYGEKLKDCEAAGKRIETFSVDGAFISTSCEKIDEWNGVGRIAPDTRMWTYLEIGAGNFQFGDWSNSFPLKPTEEDILNF